MWQVVGACHMKLSKRRQKKKKKKRIKWDQSDYKINTDVETTLTDMYECNLV